MKHQSGNTGGVVYKRNTCHSPGKEENRGTWRKYDEEGGENYVG